MATNKEREVPDRIVVRRKRGDGGGHHGGGHHGGGHHGGAWKVAFADFMTAMFALFLVLWLVNQSSDVTSAIAGYFQDPLGRASEYGSSILPGEGAQAQTVRHLDPMSVLEMRRDRLQMVADRLKERLEQVPQLLPNGPARDATAPAPTAAAALDSVAAVPAATRGSGITVVPPAERTP